MVVIFDPEYCVAKFGILNSEGFLKRPDHKAGGGMGRVSTIMFGLTIKKCISTPFISSLSGSLALS